MDDLEDPHTSQSKRESYQGRRRQRSALPVAGTGSWGSFSQLFGSSRSRAGSGGSKSTWWSSFASSSYLSEVTTGSADLSACSTQFSLGRSAGSPSGDGPKARTSTFGRITGGCGVCPCLPWQWLCYKGRGDNVQLWWLKRKKFLKAALTGLIVSIHLLVSAVLVHRATTHDTIWNWPSWMFAAASIGNITLPLALWLTFEWMRGECSAAARQAGWLFLFYWHTQCIRSMAKTFSYHWLWRWSVFGSRGEFCMTVWAVWWRVAMAERAVESTGYARYVAILGGGELVSVVWRVILYANGYGGSSFNFLAPKFDAFYQLGSFVVMGILCWIFFTSIIRKINDRECFLDGKHYLRDEAHWAVHALRRIRGALLLLCTGGAVSRVVKLWSIYRSSNRGHWVKGWVFLHDVPTNLYLLLDFATLLMTVGYCQKKFQNLRPAPPCSGEQADPNQQQEAPSSRRRRSTGWRRTVHKLGCRYITAGELLEFYSKLEEVMPHFDPFQHTTNDIVRAVIIPNSLKVCGSRGMRGRAYADWLQKDRDERRQTSSPASQNCDTDGNPVAATISDNLEAEVITEVAAPDLEAAAANQPAPTTLYAECMVTHEWRNLFLHLVAAVLADAIGQDEYGPIARDLLSPTRILQVRAKLHKHQAENLRYWICAFCVNQHHGICGGFPAQPEEGSSEADRAKANRIDTVLKNEHTLCHCREAKYWVGDQCEMNKFSDLMSLLRKNVPHLRQVVAIDRGFDLFSRVWCVAEMVTARLENLQQNVCLLWKRALDANSGDLGVYLKLATISVENCSAARAADREEILSNIREIWGVAEFDAKLQATIFGPRGLLAKDLVGFDVIFSAARAALRIEKAADVTGSGSLHRSGSRLPI